MDRTQLITIIVTAVVSVIAKELFQWFWGVCKTLSITNTIKAKFRALFTKTNRAILWDIVGIVFYGGVLVNFALQDSSPTRLEILLMLGAALLLIIMAVSLLFHVTKASIEREQDAKQRETTT